MPAQNDKSEILYREIRANYEFQNDTPILLFGPYIARFPWVGMLRVFGSVGCRFGLPGAGQSTGEPAVVGRQGRYLRDGRSRGDFSGCGRLMGVLFGIFIGGAYSRGE